MSKEERIASNVAKALRIQAELDIRKALYDELDKVIAELVTDGFREISFGDKRVVIQDNFASTNTVFRQAGVKRWELKVLKAKD